MNTINNLLLIDDDDIFVFMTKKIISDTHLANQIKVCGNGKEAIEFLEQIAEDIELLPEIIFLDLSMPILDGWGFLEKYIILKPKFGKKVTLYILSSSVSLHDIQRAKSYAAVSDYIVKPVTREKFIHIIENL